MVIELQKKLLTNEQKLGIYAHPLGLSVGKKGLGLEGLKYILKSFWNFNFRGHIT